MPKDDLTTILSLGTHVNIVRATFKRHYRMTLKTSGVNKDIDGKIKSAIEIAIGEKVNIILKNRDGWSDGKNAKIEIQLSKELVSKIAAAIAAKEIIS
jgi:hypothetical protein